MPTITYSPEKVTPNRDIITPRVMITAAVVVISILCGLLLPWLDTKIAIALILIFPAIVMGVYILRNPFLGVFFYYLYEFLRPYDFIPALQPLRLALVIEVLTLVSWIFWLIQFRSPIKWHQFNSVYFAFVCSMAVGVYLAVNTFLAYNTFLLVLTGFIMFFIASNTIDTVKRLEKVVWLLILIHVYYALVGIYNYMFSAGFETSGAVGSSFIGDENDFAMTLNVMIPIVFFLSVYYRQRWKILFCYAILVLFVLGIVASFSRGGMVGMVAAVSFCIYFSGKRALYFSLALIGALIFFGLSPDKYIGEIQTITDTSESTADARLRYWAAGGRMFLAYPILGVGAQNGGIHMPAFITGKSDPNTQWGRTFHGLFPQVAAELGSIGLILYLLMIYLAVSLLNRIRKRNTINNDQLKLKFLAHGFLGSFVAFFVTSTFLSTAYYPQLWTVYMLAIAMFWIERSLDKDTRETFKGHLVADIEPKLSHD